MVHYSGQNAHENWFVMMESLRYKLWSFLHQPAFRQDVDLSCHSNHFLCQWASHNVATDSWWLFIDVVNRQRDRKRDRQVFMLLSFDHLCTHTFQNQYVRARDHSGVPSTPHTPCSFFKLENNRWMSSSFNHKLSAFMLAFHQPI